MIWQHISITTNQLVVHTESIYDCLVVFSCSVWLGLKTAVLDRAILQD